MTLSLRMLMLPLLLTFALSIGGCGGNAKTGDVDATDAAVDDLGASQEFELNADSDSGKAGGLRSIYFDFNSASLTTDSIDALNTNADLLKSNEKIEIQVEGHCDERGGVQYNLALGDKRAKTVKDYLISLGVESTRVDTISFGKDRPVAFGHDEGAWSQNRRGNFVVTAK